MYWPPESGNIEPSSAKATHAQSEIAPPKIQTRKNNLVLGSGPAISLAVRKIEEPMMPLTSSNTESRRLSPRTRLGFSVDFSISGAKVAGFMQSSQNESEVRAKNAEQRPLVHPIASSSEDSSGVPQRRQITAEQSPQV